MPIQVKCQCGKALNIPDTMAGKAVKCPGCATTVRVPGGAPPAAQPTAARPAAAPENSRMDDLFNEEGFSAQVAQVCPACRVEMTAGSVFCTKCGFHKEQGVRMEAHKTAGVDISHGTLALMKAKADMAKAKKLDDAVLAGAGMPWWMLALVLFMLMSGLCIAVLAVNASRRIDETISFNPMGTFLILAGSAFTTFGIGAYGMIVIHAFKEEMKKGFLAILPPYAIYHVFKNGKATWKFLAGCIVMLGVGISLIVAGGNQ
ncbi:hypothetical protein Poly51_14210 [Rubripirellula tenax]|uniref:Double zinc ribbon n=1 Tax=Rubripirellula tenax TaxID=2528015 RepID=A0A5C6FD34_9BACT|nr:hypothetical protein [Rubripirellula tenax]TWU58642.1 hypothetical protein Poly51_14210 [Rubripirellula tenax]